MEDEVLRELKMRMRKEKAMKTFTVVVSNGKTREPISFCQMSRPRFTSEDYKWILVNGTYVRTMNIAC